MNRKEYQFGDMMVRYDMDEELHVGEKRFQKKLQLQDLN